jgi:hypothetical protein
MEEWYRAAGAIEIVKGWRKRDLHRRPSEPSASCHAARASIVRAKLRRPIVQVRVRVVLGGVRSLHPELEIVRSPDETIRALPERGARR